MNYSAEESKRFGFQVYSTAINALEPEKLLSELLLNDVDVAFVRIPSSRQTELHKFHAQGIPYLVADTTVEYALKLREQEETETAAHSLEFLACDAGKETLDPALEEMVSHTWVNYSEHFSANPYLDKSCLKGHYHDLIQNCSGRSGKTWLMKQEGMPAGFLAGIYNGTSNFEVLEVAVLPGFENQGIYADAVKQIPRVLQAEGVRVVKASTQVQQLSRQRDLIASGYALSRSLLNIQLYPFFQKTRSGHHTQKLEGIGSLPELHETVSNLLQMYLREKGFTLVALQETFLEGLAPGLELNCRFSGPVCVPGERSGVVTVTIAEDGKGLIGFYQAFVESGNIA